MKKYTVLIGSLFAFAEGDIVTDEELDGRAEEFVGKGYVKEHKEKEVSKTDAPDCSELQTELDTAKDEVETLKGQLQASKNEAQAEVQGLNKHISHHHDIFNDILKDIKDLSSKDLKDKYKDWKAPIYQAE